MYAIANNVVGFRSSSIRVRVVEVKGPYDVLVITADLQDAGTYLVLDPAQLVPETGTGGTVVSHRDGLVSFAG